MSKKLRKVDVGGMYPNIFISFCLSPENYISHNDMPEYFPIQDIIAKSIHNGYKVWSKTQWGKHLIDNNIIPIPVEYRQSINELKNIKEYKQSDFFNIQSLRGIYYFKQNSKAILCQAFKSPMIWKAKVKEKLKNILEDDPFKDVIKEEYDASKRFNNTGFGATGNPFSRLFKLEVFNADTFLGRSLMLYVKARAQAIGYEIIFVDTDSFVINAEENITKLLNRWTIEWAMDTYGNRKVKLQFEDEGYYRCLYVGGNCRYMGYLVKPNGEEQLDIKGLQIKRKSSTDFEKTEQKLFLKYLLEGHNLEDIKTYIRTWIKRIYKQDILSLSKPCKFSKPREDYGNSAEFFTAYDNTQKIDKTFKKEIDEQFHYTYIKDELEIFAFDKNNLSLINKYELDYKLIIEKQILNLLVPTFAGLNFGKALLELSEEYGIILGSQYRNKLLEEYSNFDELKVYYSARVSKKRFKERVDIST